MFRSSIFNPLQTRLTKILGKYSVTLIQGLTNKVNQFSTTPKFSKSFSQARGFAMRNLENVFINRKCSTGKKRSKNI